MTPVSLLVTPMAGAVPIVLLLLVGVFACAVIAQTLREAGRRLAHDARLGR